MRRSTIGAAVACIVALGFGTATARAAGPAPGSAEYFQRDNQNMMDAYGRQSGPNGQLTPSYISELPGGTNSGYLQQVAQQVENPTRPIVDPGQWFPGWNQGNAYRQTWPGRRGLEIPVAFTNRYGALLSGCPGVPFQQNANFVYGTQDALSFFLSTPKRRYPNPAAGSAKVNSFNPLWGLFDRRPDRRTVTPGRTTKVAIVGHSLGASAVSFVEGVDRRAETVVGLDKLGADQAFGSRTAHPVIPALGIQSEYGFNVEPYWLM